MTTGKTLKEIDDELPNGLHDAYLESVSVNFASKSARLEMEVWVGDLHATTEEEREAYRRATLTLEGLEYFVIEPPYEGYVFSKEYALRIEAGEPNDDYPPTSQIPWRDLPPGVFAYWFFVSLWNSFIHVAARSAALQWIDNPSDGQ